jgi:hypothetical protein
LKEIFSRKEFQFQHTKKKFIAKLKFWRVENSFLWMKSFLEREYNLWPSNKYSREKEGEKNDMNEKRVKSARVEWTERSFGYNQNILSCR